LVLLALSGLTMWGKNRAPERIVLAIDESASMGATDVAPTRISVAKSRARKILQDMQAGDLAMIVAFSNSARVVTSYTADRDLLLRRLDSIKATDRGTSLRDALQLVAGLANPQKQVGEGEVATAVMPPRLYLFTDGGFPDVEGFSLGTIQPEVVVIGPPPQPVERSTQGIQDQASPASDNLAILALDTARDKNDPDRFHVFGRVRNYRSEPVTTRARLLRHDPRNPQKPGVLLDAVSLSLEPRADQGFEFDLAEPGGGALEVDLEVDDALPLDNRAFAAYGRPRKAQVLLVTPGNRFLGDVLGTSDALKLADVTEISPEDLQTDEVARDLISGQYDLVLFDRAQPETAPEANALYIGALPPSMKEAASRQVEYPVILDWDVSHPLLQYIRDLGSVVIRQAVAVEPPRSATELIQTSEGPIGFTVPRGGYVDAVLTFPLVEGGKPNSNWPLMYSFPLFMLNSLRVLGHA
ncbi:MAG TPA: VWA domain-containing protein, partial [Isosphaeraceae bacterium]|nr:VWA domain-containing protein [Isosphaeraceae bacterium]